MSLEASFSRDKREIRGYLPEWTLASPQTHSELIGFSFEDDPASRQIAQRLTQTGLIEITELSTGLQIRSTSVVGSIQLGKLSLTIFPKLDGLPLMRLVRYAYHLRDLQLFDPKEFQSKHLAFQDILIYQLAVEVEELFARGLMRRYMRVEEPLSSPRGRLDFQKVASHGGITEAVLPSTYYNRLENCLHNQILLSGLLLASSLTNDLTLRTRVRRLAQLLKQNVEPVRLSSQTLDRVERESNRLTESYRPAIKLVALLMGDLGIQPDEDTSQVQVKGYLFDMNRFFQALLSRFLNDCLEGFQVEDEHKLKGFLAYVRGYELPNRQDPLPRPDFAILKNGKLSTLLDAKYRDLWKEGLPRDMLYQLIVYALSRKDQRTATILYPSIASPAREARIQINEPLYGIPNGMVILRPVDLLELDRLITKKDRGHLSSLAYKLVFG